MTEQKLSSPVDIVPAPSKPCRVTGAYNKLGNGKLQGAEQPH